MKTKFKEYIKKIKNWLSSLSKWAQKNKLKVFACVFSIFLLSCSMMTCATNKKTASASSVISNTSYLVLPSFAFEGSDTNRYMSTPMYLGIYENNITLYNVSSGDGVTSQLNRLTLSTSPINSYTALCYYNVHAKALRFASFSNNGNVQTFITSNFQISVVNSIKIIVYIENGVICVCYTFYQDDNQLGQLYLKNGLQASSSVQYEYTYQGANFLTANIELDNYTQSLLEENYTSGYTSGFSTGYNKGYNEGLNTAGIDTTPFGILVNSINGLLRIDILGNVSIGDLLSIAFGCIMLGLVIKIFLGG